MKSAKQSQPERKDLIDEQQQIIEELLDNFGTIQRVAEFVGVSTDSINNWLNHDKVAKNLYRQKLIDARKKINTGSNSSPTEQQRHRPASPRGETNTTKLKEILKSLRLEPPKVRAAYLQQLLDESKLSVHRFSLELKIHENTLKKYLNPKYSSLMSLETADRISALAIRIKKTGPDAGTNKKRLEKALLTLLGETIFTEGFYPRDIRRKNAVEKISEHTKLATRTVRRYLPPVDNKKIPDVVVEAFEKAAEELGSIISDGDDQPIGD